MKMYTVKFHTDHEGLAKMAVRVLNSLLLSPAAKNELAEATITESETIVGNEEYETVKL